MFFLIPLQLEQDNISNVNERNGQRVQKQVHPTNAPALLTAHYSPQFQKKSKWQKKMTMAMSNKPNVAVISLKHLYFKCLDLWGQFVTIQVHQHFLEELKCEFEFLWIAQVECVDEPKKHGTSKRNTFQLAQKFHNPNCNSNILWLFLIISTLFFDHIKPHGCLCDVSLSFLIVDILMVKTHSKTHSKMKLLTKYSLIRVLLSSLRYAQRHHKVHSPS